jgi:hypothetical protein
MARVLSLINGIPRGVDETPIYDETIQIVASSPGAGQSLPITSGTPVTLPGGQTYNGQELQIFISGQYAEDVLDYVITSATQVTFNFNLNVGDLVRFRIDRLPPP